MKDFKIIHEKIVYKDGRPYPYNITHKKKKIDIYKYAQDMKMEVKDALSELETHGGYVSPTSNVLFFADYEKIRDVIKKLSR